MEHPEDTFFSFLASRPDLCESLVPRLPVEIFSPEGKERLKNRAFGPLQVVDVAPEATTFLKTQMLALLGREIGRSQRNGLDLSKIRETMALVEECSVELEPPPVEAYEEAEPQVRSVIPTGIEPLDNQIRGLSCGDLGIVALPSGKGKTALLINFAASALFEGRQVLYVTVADQSRDEIIPRIDACILEEVCPSGLSQSELQEFHRRAVRRLPGRLWLADYTDRSCGLGDLARIMSLHPTDIVIVDHADDVQSPYSDDPTVTRHSLRVVYMALKKLAVRFNVPIWTASQTHEQSWHYASLGVDGLAEAKTGKATGAAIVLVFTGGNPEIQGTMYCTIAKARRSFTERIIRIQYDWALTRAW